MDSQSDEGKKKKNNQKLFEKLQWFINVVWMLNPFDLECVVIRDPEFSHGLIELIFACAKTNTVANPLNNHKLKVLPFVR